MSGTTPTQSSRDRQEIGSVEAVVNSPVKSMAGQRLECANLGWNGIAGDRRLAFRRIHDRSGFPWLTAGKLPELVLYSPQCFKDDSGEHLPTHVRTPDGRELPAFSEELAAEVGGRHGASVEMTYLKHGIFDEFSISVIASETVKEIARLARLRPDVRRFRPNLLVRLRRPLPFQEDDWLGGVLSFGDAEESPAVAVTARDLRCAMVNVDADSATASPEMLKTIVRVNQGNAGIYCTVCRTGRLEVGQTVFLHAQPGITGTSSCETG